ncbi:MAG TPA: hypothetical protein VMV93_04820, partial [Chloroflexota bacterium]|nr:hypothetical protein [Chloroflexota bacterium]
MQAISQLTGAVAALVRQCEATVERSYIAPDSLDLFLLMTFPSPVAQVVFVEAALPSAGLTI